jgi:HAD superfamily hydrolase (TIGR01509 family)
MTYGTVLFDWDGCLADTLNVWMKTYLAVYLEYGFDVTPEVVIEKSWGNTDQGPRNIGISDNQKCWEEIVAKVKVGVARVPLHQGAKNLLRSLHEEQINIAIVTSSERQVVQPALEFHDIEKYIGIMVTDNDVTNPKPDPEMVVKAMKHFRAYPDDTLIIGDTDKDIRAGQNAGIDTGLILHETNRRFYDFDKLMLAGPTHTFSELPQVLNLFLRKST